ncbi:MAG: hypothetical protein RDU20_00170 [Desulfomonilaceae bacterium]|nr:hypothetical protein [Desulfomonilaceae bacterium]
MYAKKESVRPLIQAVALALLLCGGCSTESPRLDVRGDNGRVAGTWMLEARVVDGNVSPANERFIKLRLSPDGTFSADFRGEPQQPWIRAGQGAFLYDPPLLSLFWDGGASVTFLVTESEPDRMKLHRGRNLVPLKEQEPDEIFVRHRIEQGPTKKPS